MDPKDSDRNLFYLLLRKDGSTKLPAPGAAYTAPQQPINPAAAPSVPASSRLPAAPQQTISDPEALLVVPQQPMDVFSAPVETPSTESEHQQGLAGSETVAVVPWQPVVHLAEQESALHLHQPSEGNAAPQGLASEQCDMMSTATCMQSGSEDLQQATAAEADTGAAETLLEQAPHADQTQPPGSQSKHHALLQLDEPELEPGIGSCNHDVPIMGNADAWQTQAAPMQPPHTYQLEQEPHPTLVQTHTDAAAQQPASSDQVDITHNHMALVQFLQPPETAQSEARPALGSDTTVQCRPASVVRHDQIPVQQQLQHQIHQPSDGITCAPTACPAPEASPPTDASATDPPTHPEQPQSANIPPDALPEDESIPPEPQLPAQSLASGLPATSGADINLVPPGTGLAAVAVTSPRQGELRGVLGAACSQIIAKQQARSPNAFLQHQSPRGASPTEQYSLSPTPVQNSTDHHNVKAGSSHIHYEGAPSPGQQATHSPVQQAVHHTGQMPVQQAPQPPVQLPLDRSQELEDEWTNMLIDLPEAVQHDAAQMPCVDHLGALEVSSPQSPIPTGSFPGLLNGDQNAQDHMEVADVEMQDAAPDSDELHPSDSLMHPPASAVGPEAQPPEAELQQPTVESDRGLPKVTLPSQQMPTAIIDMRCHGQTRSLIEPGQLTSEQLSPKPSGTPLTAPSPVVTHQETRMGLQQSDQALDATTSTDVSAMVDCTHLHADQQQLALQQSAQYANFLNLDEGDVASDGAEQAAQPAEAPNVHQDAAEQGAALQELPADLTEQATLDDVGPEAEAERPHTRSTRLLQSAVTNQEAMLEEPAASAEHAGEVLTALSLPEQSSQPDPEASELEAEHTAVAEEMHSSGPRSSAHAVASQPALLEQACDGPMQLDAPTSDLPQTSEPHQDEQDADHGGLLAASASAWDTATDRPRTRLRRSLESAAIRQLLLDTAPAEPQMATCAAASDVHKPTQPPCQAGLLSAAQPEDTVVDDTADAVAREKPHTRLRQSLQGAAESPSIAAKDAKAISPQCKLKSKLQQKSPAHRPKQQAQHAKHGSKAGTLRKPQSPQHAPAAKHQPQQQLVQQAPSGKSPSKASSKGMAVVKNGKRKRSDLRFVEAWDNTPAVGPPSKLSNSPAATQKRSSIPR